MAKKVLGNSVTEFSILELSGAKNPGIFCPLKKKILEFSRIFFLEFHEKLVFPEFSGPRIFHPAIFCLEIFCPGILFPGKFWHSYVERTYLTLLNKLVRIRQMQQAAKKFTPNLLFRARKTENRGFGEINDFLEWR